MVVRGGPGQPIVYNHVPRTAGASFIAALVNALQPHSPFVGFDRSTFGPFTTFEQLNTHLRRQLVLQPQGIPPHADAVMGHLSPSTTRARFAELTQLTLLREPRTRIVSHWLYWRAQTTQSMRGWGDWAAYVKFARASLAYFLDDPDAAFATDNVITRCLVWPHPLTPEDDFIDPAHDEELVDTARTALQGFDFVGVLEDQLVAERLAHFLDTPLHPESSAESSFPRRNANWDIAEECHDASATELLVERSRLDAVLWDHVASSTYLPHQAVEVERESLFRAAVEHYALSAAEAQADGSASAWGQVLAFGRSRGRSDRQDRQDRPPVLSP